MFVCIIYQKWDNYVYRHKYCSYKEKRIRLDLVRSIHKLCTRHFCHILKNSCTQSFKYIHQINGNANLLIIYEMKNTSFLLR